MAGIDISSGKTILSTGLLQLQNGVAMSSTLTSVTDQSNTASTLKLSTTSAQFTSPLRITTDDPSDFYLDCEDGSTNNRFSITRNTASQQVNLNFASNPAGSTTIVGAIRTYVDGVNLSEVMTFVENGNVGVGTGATTPAGKFDIVSDGGGQLLFSRYGGQPQIIIRRSQGTFAAPTAVVGGASSVLAFQNYDGTSFGTSAQIQSVPTENQTPTAKGASLALNVVQSGTTSVINGLIVSGGSTNPGSVSITTNFSAASARLSIWQTALSSTLPYFNIQEIGGGKLLEFSNAGNLLVGSGSPSDTARVSIKGSGSTSATTSLLVQNSSGTELFKIADNGNVSFDATHYINSSNIYGNFYQINDWIIRGGFTNDSGSIQIKTETNFGGNTNNNTSAYLQIDSISKGFLPPRMTDAQVRAIASPAVGLMAFNTDLDCPVFYSAAGWRKISHSVM